MDEDRAFSALDEGWRKVAERVRAQQWLPGILYVVATPIGNLGDLGLRAWQVLTRVAVIAAEDTRISRHLLNAWGISTPLMAVHRHNEVKMAKEISARLAAGQSIALISDAGAPAVSDPGAHLVRTLREAGHVIVPIPGPSAVITALMASGVTTDENPAYVFAGFPPSKSMARQRWLARWCVLEIPVVLFEAPHRLGQTLTDLEKVCGADRTLTIARELTKRFEEISTLAMHQALSWLEAHPQRAQGEFVLIVHAAPGVTNTETVTVAIDALLQALLASLSVRDAARVAARISSLPRDALYARALALQER